MRSFFGSALVRTEASFHSLRESDMPVLHTESSGRTYAMDDLEKTKKHMDVTVTSLGGSTRRPPLGRRKTTNESGSGTGVAGSLDYDHEEDGLTRVGNVIWKIHKASLLTRYALYILPIALILAIPIMVLLTAYKNNNPDQNGHGPLHEHIHLVGLFVWIEELWVILWIAKIGAHYVPVSIETVSWSTRGMRAGRRTVS